MVQDAAEAEKEETHERFSLRPKHFEKAETLASVASIL